MQPISKHHPKLEILHGHPRENGDPIDSRLRENDKGESGNDIVERRYHATNLETQHRNRASRPRSIWKISLEIQGHWPVLPLLHVLQKGLWRWGRNDIFLVMKAKGHLGTMQRQQTMIKGAINGVI